MPEQVTLEVAIERFASEAGKKLGALSAKGEPEDQIRAPLEALLYDLADVIGVGRDHVVLVGESSIADLKTRPDYAVQSYGALVGFVEVKAPGKGGDPSKFKDKHDKDQWSKLKALPNLIYTDGNEFSLWRDGERIGKTVRLDGDIANQETATTALGLDGLVADFLRWQPIPPKTPKQLAELTARVCRLMRDEVQEQLGAGNPALTNLADEWRRLLFPDADDSTFADGYAQAVTFGLLVARARGISVADGVTSAANSIGTDSLIGAALLVLALNTEKHAALKTSIGTLSRILEVVDWYKISKGESEAWLYFYEDFLSVYDSKLRKRTGSYYTPPEVVTAMTGFVDAALKRRFARPKGLAESDVTVVDPAVGTGTFLLAALRSIAETTSADQGPGAIAGQVEQALSRLIGFEIQLGPFAVAQLRLLAELVDLGATSDDHLRMFVTDTLSNPFVEDEGLGILYEPIAESRREANKVKKDQPVLVVIGNPPYKNNAEGRGGWIETGHPEASVSAPLDDWQPPKDWGIGTHAKHLRNLYVYFWRWATWKVFDHHVDHKTGIVCFITVAGFLNGPGFQMMRQYLRKTAEEIWVIDCSPDGHQPGVNTRIFQGVQQPVCIVMASRSAAANLAEPANVRFRSLPVGHRTGKFDALSKTDLDDDGWIDCPDGWRDPFLPASLGAWSNYPALTDLFVYDGSGVMPGRTWIVAPDSDTLKRRWAALTNALTEEKAELFHPHLRKGKPGDKHIDKEVSSGLAGHEFRGISVGADSDDAIPPVRYGFRTLDRQWIVPDARLINQPNPGLWRAMSENQIHLTALQQHAPTCGPAATVTSLMPDLHHYKGSFGGRVMPLWLDNTAATSNLRPGVLGHLSELFGAEVDPSSLFAYIVAIISHPAYVQRFSEDLTTPGLHVPLTADPRLFNEAAELGRRSIWLQTYGERMTDPTAGRPHARPRLAEDRAPKVPAHGTISTAPGEMADYLDYDSTRQRLVVGGGFIKNVTPQMWEYNVSGKSVITQWFSYRRANREKPLIGDKRPPSKLEKIQPDRWLPDYTTELLDLLHVIGLLIDLEGDQAQVLDAIVDGPQVSLIDLTETGALGLPADYPTKPFRSSGAHDFPELPLT